MPRPEGVRVIRCDGTVIPCELSCVGSSEDGREFWSIATVMGPDDRLEYDNLPPNTWLVGNCAGAGILSRTPTGAMFRRIPKQPSLIKQALRAVIIAALRRME